MMRRRRSALSDGAANDTEPAMLLMFSSHGFVHLFQGILSPPFRGVDTGKTNDATSRSVARMAYLPLKGPVKGGEPAPALIRGRLAPTCRGEPGRGPLRATRSLVASLNRLAD